MRDYFIRCGQADIPALRTLGQALGLLSERDGVWVATPPHAYQEIGPILRIDPPPPLAPDGSPYWHANLRFAGPSLFEHAQAVLAANPSPELAAALEPANFGRFFVIDPATGEATRPEFPTVVFA